MKKLKVLLASMLVAGSIFAQVNPTPAGVAINKDGSSADASAILDVKSTDQGVLVPRMTADQRGLISSPATGLLVYQTDAPQGFYFYNGSAWTTLQGANGQGVPTGGTAGQVLSKKDGVDYNTEWVTPASGGTALPAQTGNSGKVLTTDGTNLSWGSSGGTIIYEMHAKVTVAQTTAVGASTLTPNCVKFGSIDNQSQKQNITMINDTTFQVGANGAGLYLFDVQLIANGSVGVVPIVDFNAQIPGPPPNNLSGYQSYNLYGGFTSIMNSAPAGFRFSGSLNGVQYLTAGQTFKVRALSPNTSFGAALTSDGSSWVKIVKLK